MALPHYSRVIKGKSIAQGPEYGDRTRLGQGSGVEGDETEDLYLLLQDVLVCQAPVGMPGSQCRAKDRRTHESRQSTRIYQPYRLVPSYLHISACASSMSRAVWVWYPSHTSGRRSSCLCWSRCGRAGWRSSWSKLRVWGSAQTWLVRACGMRYPHCASWYVLPAIIKPCTIRAACGDDVLQEGRTRLLKHVMSD